MKSGDRLWVGEVVLIGGAADGKTIPATYLAVADVINVPRPAKCEFVKFDEPLALDFKDVLPLQYKVFEDWTARLVESVRLSNKQS